MARVQSNNKNKRQSQPNQTKKPIAERRESAKGDLFFKIVISILIVGIVGVLIWFLIDTLMSGDPDEDDFNIHQYVLLDDLQRIKDSVADVTQSELIFNSQLRDALFTGAITDIYVLFFDSNWEELDEDSVDYQRHRAAWEQFELLLEAGNRNENEDSDDYQFISFNNIAVFMLDISMESNQDWWRFLNEVKDENDPVLPPFGPSFLRIDLNDASAVFSVTYGAGSAVADAIEAVTTFVKENQ